jgi:hypothetical protein
MKKQHFIKIETIALSDDEHKLLNQIWRDEYSDCVTLEEMVRRLARQKIVQRCRIRRAFNIYDKRRKDGESLDEILDNLRQRKYPVDGIKEHHEEEEKKKQQEVQKKTK